jgi:hypothetical protein
MEDVKSTPPPTPQQPIKESPKSLSLKELEDLMNQRTQEYNKKAAAINSTRARLTHVLQESLDASQAYIRQGDKNKKAAEMTFQASLARTDAVKTELARLQDEFFEISHALIKVKDMMPHAIAFMYEEKIKSMAAQPTAETSQ